MSRNHDWLGVTNMPRPYARCREKIGLAVHALAVGEGDVRSRLKFAYRHLRRLSPSELPPDELAEWKSIITALTQHGPERAPDGNSGKSSIDYTMSRIRNRTGRELAIRVYDLNSRISDYW